VEGDEIKIVIPIEATTKEKVSRHGDTEYLPFPGMGRWLNSVGTFFQVSML
jgi:hypothetical protein